MTLRITPEPQALAFSVPGPRTLDGLRAVTIQRWCTSCPARPWQPCGPDGSHLARWYSALMADAITGAEMASAVEAAGTGRADAVVPS